ncbi:L-proline dehydrogenase [Sinomicrobium oceani]|uniref:L-proline dehydrogenase n=1 Tax=Sinomicrobium oceani TaxID=1150368 RepID=A0A1K1QMR4_9FLAO|nr:proline dehydrogenase family protein [Sinomicrobium oceani]SFW60996.1 L-proline dehydrogenase [Sinomicrobium oceani]
MEKIFEDTKTAFALKTDVELERAYFLFKLIANQPLVRIGTAVTNFALKTHLPVEGLIRSTVFDQFCGGISEEDCMPVIDKIYEKGVSSVLDYSVEGKNEENPLDESYRRVIDILNFVKEKDSIPFAVFKPSSYGRLSLFQKVNDGEKLTVREQDEWDRVVNRFDSSCRKAYQLDVALLIDAEEYWIQDAVDNLITDMMRKYNKEKAVVYNTLQMYRWDRMDYLKKLYKQAEEEEFYVGVKLVRGAYMEKENERAEEKGYPTPICSSKEATDKNYNEAVHFMADHLDRMAIFAGTHNEDSSYLLMELMEEKGIAKDDPRVWFGQLYGMSDHISYNLGARGYNVAKYLPFGPVKDVMPYLIRRAEENTSVAGQTSRELSLLKKEKKRRKL